MINEEAKVQLTYLDYAIGDPAKSTCTHQTSAVCTCIRAGTSDVTLEAGYSTWYRSFKPEVSRQDVSMPPLTVQKKSRDSPNGASLRHAYRYIGL